MNNNDSFVEQIYNIVKNEEYLKNYVWKTHIINSWNRNEIFFITENNKVISFIIIQKYKRKKAVKLWVIATRKEYRRKGYLFKVLEKVKKQFLEYTFICECRTENYPMNCFLKKHGFVKKGEKFVGKNKDIKINVYVFDNTTKLEKWL